MASLSPPIDSPLRVLLLVMEPDNIAVSGKTLHPTLHGCPPLILYLLIMEPYKIAVNGKTLHPTLYGCPPLVILSTVSTRNRMG